MDRLYQIISRHFSQSEIANLASDLGIYVPANADPTSMARELFSGARRNLRLDVLFFEVYSRKADLKLDLHPNLYELIAGTFSEQEAAALARKLGLDRLSVGLDTGGLIGWNNDDFFKNRKAKTLQETAEKQNKYGDLLAEMKNIRPSLDLTIFQQTAPERAAGQGEGQPPPPEEKRPGHQAEGTPQTVQYIQNIYGDQYGGDRVEGGKAGGNLFKDINITGVSGSAISLGGDAVVETTIKDTQGDVTVGGEGDPGGREALLLLVERINQDLAAIKSELRERDAREAAEDMEEVSRELRAEEPDGSWIIRKLNNVAQIAGATGAAASAVNQLGPHIKQAIQLAQSLFGG